MIRDCFSTYHPSINFVYFAFVILVTIFLYHPALLAISFGAALAYAIYLGGTKAVKLSLFALLPAMALAVTINILTNHAGMTIRTYLWNNPITLESIQFGVAAAAMLGAALLWFYCYSAVMTSDKFVYLFGRVLPSLSLIFSMALRFVPRFAAQIKRVARAQSCLGRSAASGGAISRARHGLKLLSIMATWALESAVETADSMKARGYGAARRTAYSMYRFDARDRTLFIVLLILLVAILAAIATGIISVRYFPSFRVNADSPLSISALAAFAAVCFMPLILQIKEEAAWRFSISKI